MLIKEKAMLVALHISMWSGEKVDHEVTADVNERHGASVDAGQYKKALLPRHMLQPVRRAANELRTFHRKNTLPWNNEGMRMLPAQNFQDYSTGIRKRRRDFEGATAALVKNYEAEVENQKTRLGRMYNANEYPAIEQISELFAVNTDVASIADGDDFRIKVSKEEAEEIKNSIEVTLKRRIDAAVEDTYDRIESVLTKLKDKMEEKDPSFKDTITANIIDLADILPRLNLFEDPKVNLMAKKLRENFSFDPNTLRESKSQRKEVAQTAETLINEVKNWY
jgi:hypothetical protein